MKKHVDEVLIPSALVEAGTDVLDEAGPGNGMLNFYSRYIRSYGRYQIEGLNDMFNT